MMMMKKSIIISIVLLSLLMLMTTAVHAFTKIASSSGLTNEQRFYSVVHDTVRNVVLTSTLTSPGIIVKFDSNSLTRIDAVSGKPGEDNFYALALDENRGFVYAAAHTSPAGHVVRFDSVTMSRQSRVSGNETLGEEYFGSVAISSNNTYLYVGCRSVPGHLVKFDVSSSTTMIRIGVASGVSTNSYHGEINFHRLWLNADNTFAFVLTNNPYPWVIKFDVVNMKRIHPPFSTDTGYCDAAAVDTVGNFGYAAGGGDLFSLVRYDFKNMQRQAIQPNFGNIPRPSSMVIDTSNEILYMGTQRGVLMKADVYIPVGDSTAPMTYLDAIDIGTYVTRVSWLVIDMINNIIFATLDQSGHPGQIVKIDIRTDSEVYLVDGCGPSSQSQTRGTRTISGEELPANERIILRNINDCDLTISDANVFHISLTNSDNSNITFKNIICNNPNSSFCVEMTEVRVRENHKLSIENVAIGDATRAGKFGIGFWNLRVLSGAVSIRNVSYEVNDILKKEQVRQQSNASVYNNNTSSAYYHQPSTYAAVKFFTNVANVNGTVSIENVQASFSEGEFLNTTTTNSTNSTNSNTNTTPNRITMPILTTVLYDSSRFSTGAITSFNIFNCSIVDILPSFCTPKLCSILRLKNFVRNFYNVTSNSILFSSSASSPLLAEAMSFSSTNDVAVGNASLIISDADDSATSTFVSDSAGFLIENNGMENMHSELFSSSSSTSSSPIIDFNYTPWTISCNSWPNAIVSRFKLNIMQSRFLHSWPNFLCRATFSESESFLTPTSTFTQELSESQTMHETVSPTPSSSVSKVDDSMTVSSTMSASTSATIYCYNLVDEAECGRAGLENCHYCPDRQTCVPKQDDCGCVHFSRELCQSPSIAKGCAYCDNVGVCIEDIYSCECYVLDYTKCFASSDCRWCPNFKSCLPLREDCYCSSLSETPCDRLSNNKCKYCGDQQICLPVEDVNENKCSCMKMNSSNCQQSTCTWCSEYQTCSVPEWDCNCLSYSNDSTSCTVNSNSHCKYCSDEDVCVDTQKFTCRCENFTQSACDASSCKWCDDLNSCSVPQNTNCSCYYLRGEDSCSLNSNNKCKWCAESTDTGKDGQKKLEDFNYCVNKEQDQCECSYLSPSFCSFSNQDDVNNRILPSSLNFSTTCRFCVRDHICTHPENKDCDCGNFVSRHACGLATTCSWKEPVLTIEGGSEYCSAAASTCAPVTCEGILSPASCRNSGCEWDSTTSRCTSSTCFNFFVPGFTPLSFLLYAIGLVKDVLVVFLIGAFSCYINRPVMKIYTSINKRIKNQLHIKQRMDDKTKTVYMCDKRCRDDLTITFSQYVEKVCDAVFELESEDLLDEKNRVLLFDTVAFTLYDEMIWLDIEMLKTAKPSTSSFSTSRFVADDDNMDDEQELEMKDYFVEDDGVKDDQDDIKNGTKQTEQKQKQKKQFDDENDDDLNILATPKNGAADDDDGDEMPRRKMNTRRGEKEVEEEEQEDWIETFARKVIDRVKNYHGTAAAIDKNDDDRTLVAQMQLSARFAAFAEIESHNLRENQNRQLLKVKVLLSAKDFGSAVALREKVVSALLARAACYVFYDQSRSRMVCGATGLNQFPPAITLLYYSIALIALFISSFYTVYFQPNIDRMVQSCESTTAVDASSSSSNITTTAAAAPSSNTTSTSSFIQIDSTFLTGAYFLLGFRLLNSSAFSTAILVLVKTLRGMYQKYSGIYTLSLQERIPLMALYSDRAIHVVLFIYSLLVLPFAFTGPFYGGFVQSVHCWVPIFIGVGILLGDALLLFLTRKLSGFVKSIFGKDGTSTKRTFEMKKNSGSDDRDESPLAKAFASEFADAHETEGKAETTSFPSPSSLPMSPKEEGNDERNYQQQDQERIIAAPPLPPPTAMNEDYEDIDELLDEDILKHQSSITSTSPVEIWNALLVFILTEEVPVVVLSLALQLSFNYCALLQYSTAFGVSEDSSLVYSRDYDSRNIDCIIIMFKADVSSILSGLSSFVPFM